MSLSVMAGFWAVSLLLVITPGADWAYAISAGLRGRGAVIPAVAGMMSAHLGASPLQWALKGACLAGLNPKLFLFFLALLPQFTRLSEPWSVPAQIMCLGLLHIFGCSLVYLAVGFGAQRLLSSRPAAARRVSQMSGGIMMVIACVLAYQRIVA
jgi:threonine/homoserine/homoserine lactone efflux protein